MKNTATTVLTERGQISVPVAIRKRAHLIPGQRLRWQQVAPDTFSVTIEPRSKKKACAVDAIGYARVFSADEGPKRTDEIMKILRAGEK